MQDALRKNLVKGRILAIDADLQALQFFDRLLTPEGYHLVSAPSWSAAQSRLQRESFDLVVTDLQPGEGRGAETVTMLRANRPEQEVLVTVAPNQLREGVAALRQGAAAYLLRPVVLDELAVWIGRVLDRGARQGEVQRLIHENIEFRANATALHKCMAFLRLRDIDRLGDLILDTLMELVRAESGVLWLSGIGQDGYRLRCRRGLAQVVPDNRSLADDAEEFVFLQATEPVLSKDGSRLFVPLRCGGELLGLIKIESPSERKRFELPETSIAATATEFAATALYSLLLVQRSEHDLLRTPGGEAYNMTFFRDHLEKELLTAQRYGRHLSMIKLVVDNYRELVARFHDRQVGEALQRVMATVNTVLRDADILSQSAPGVYYILLPETDAWGALITQRRIRKAVRGHLLVSDMKKDLPIRLAMRSASCPGDGPTLAALDRTMEGRLATLRKSILLRGRFEDEPFWSVIDILFGANPRLPASHFEQEGGGRYFTISGPDLESLCGMICRDALEAHRGRGLILRGCADFAPLRQQLDSVAGCGEQGVAVYLLGGAARPDWSIPGIVPIHIDDSAFVDRTFLLCLGEDHAYALVAERDGEQWRAFHSADIYFVENMLAKIQEQYQLQAQI